MIYVEDFWILWTSALKVRMFRRVDKFKTRILLGSKIEWFRKPKKVPQTGIAQISLWAREPRGHPDSLHLETGSAKHAHQVGIALRLNPKDRAGYMPPLELWKRHLPGNDRGTEEAQTDLQMIILSQSSQD